MINNKLKKIIKSIITVVVILLLCIMSYSLGYGIKEYKYKNETKNNTNQSSIVEKQKQQITEETVKDFLITYYTKKDLGENRDRYKPYLTDGMYNAIVSNEDKASNKAYKGYIVDYEYEGADIYINNETKEVIVNVRYKNTTLAIKDDRSNTTTKTHRESFKLSYVSTGGKLLINKMDKITIEPYVERGQ